MSLLHGTPRSRRMAIKHVASAVGARSWQNFLNNQNGRYAWRKIIRVAQNITLTARASITRLLL